MRIGELLLESALVNAKDLGDALYYMHAKGLPLGRCLKILRSITEEDLTRALEAQKLIRKGLDTGIAIEILKTACSKDIPFHEALAQRQKLGPLVPSKPAASNAGGSAAAFTVPGLPGMLPSDSQIKPRIIEPAVKKSSDELITEGDQLLLDDRCKEAEKSYLAAREILLAEPGATNEKTAICLVKLANLYLSLDRFAEAEPLYQKVLEIYTKLRGPGDILVAKALEDLGDLYSVRGDYLSAERFFNQSFDIVDKLPSFDLKTSGRLLNKLSAAKRAMDAGSASDGKTATGSGGTESGASNAESKKRIGEYCIESGLLTQERFQQALQRAKQSSRPVGTILRDEKFLQQQQIESVLFAQLMVKEGAVPYSIAVRALSIASKAGIPLKDLAESGRLVSEINAGDEAYRQIVLEHERLVTAENSQGAEHPEVAAIAVRLADLVLARGDRQSAILLFKRAFNIFNKSATADKRLTAASAEKLASAHIDDGNYIEAQPLLFKALEIRQSCGDAESTGAVLCLGLLGKVESAQENVHQALTFYRSALSLHDKISPPSECDEKLVDAYASCCAQAGMLEESLGLRKRLVTWSQTKFGPFEPETAVLMEKLADALVDAGDAAQAQGQYYFALQIYERSLDSAKASERVKTKLATLASAHGAAKVTS